MNVVGKPHEEEAEMDATTVAIDLAKDIFEVALANRAGRIIERKPLARRPGDHNHGSVKEPEPQCLSAEMVSEDS
jgi:hypothetical protein